MKQIKITKKKNTNMNILNNVILRNCVQLNSLNTVAKVTF